MPFVKSLLLCACLYFPAALLAQQKASTQYFTLAQALNPALTGQIDEQMRLSGNYRTQWVTASPIPLTAGSVSIEVPALRAHLPAGNSIGVGLFTNGYYDGPTRINGMLVAASLSYRVALSLRRTQFFSWGVQGSFMNKQMEVTAPTGQGKQILRADYPDISAGMTYTRRFSAEAELVVGYGIYQLAGTAKALGPESAQATRMRHNLHAAAKVMTGAKTDLYGAVIYQQQGNAGGFIGAVYMGYAINEKAEEPFSLFAGSIYSYPAVVSPYVGAEWHRLRLGASYDISLSRHLLPGHIARGIEVSLVFRLGRVQNGQVCPRFY